MNTSVKLNLTLKKSGSFIKRFYEIDNGVSQ